MARLTEKQQRFVEEYLVDLNATQAAIRAGYSEKTAEAIGYENLRKPQIAEAINSAMAKRSARTEITQDMVLRELARVAFANGSDFARVESREAPVTVIDEDGNPHQEMGTVQTVRILDTDNVDPEKLAAIASIKEGKRGIEIRSHDKVRALELLGRHLGMFEGKSELDRREQEARIANLEKQASRDDSGTKQVTVVLEGVLDEYAG